MKIATILLMLVFSASGLAAEKYCFETENYTAVKAEYKTKNTIKISTWDNLHLKDVYTLKALMAALDKNPEVLGEPDGTSKGILDKDYEAKNEYMINPKKYDTDFSWDGAVSFIFYKEKTKSGALVNKAQARITGEGFMTINYSCE